MERAVRILAALFATAAALVLGCLVVFVALYVRPEFANLRAHPHDAALYGLILGCGVMFTLIYAQAARLIWRRVLWKRAMLLAAASCFGLPLGPVLGIAALVLLTRPAVRAKFRS